MISKTKGLLCCVILTLSLVALVQHQDANAPIQIANPTEDPKFFDLAESGYQPPSNAELMIAGAMNQSIQDAHQAEYAAALDNYQREEEAAAREASEHAETRDILIGWILVAFLLLALTFLPWRRWNDNASKKTTSAAEEAGKLTARGLTAANRGLTAAKAMMEPSPIVGRSGLKTYSVADELSKWSALHAEGVVSQAEFEEARAALLKREP